MEEDKTKNSAQGGSAYGGKISELRQDIVTGDWVVVSTIRGRRPDEFVSNRRRAQEDPGKICLFCDPEKSGQEKDILIYKTEDGDWSLRIFPNKYPAFTRPSNGSIKHKEEGPYFWMESVGYHEIIVTRDHARQIALMDKYRVAEIVDAYQERYIDLMNKKSVSYIEIFHNHGEEAGASIPHPHSQLMAIPVVSPYVQAELIGAENYWRANKHCVYCSMLEWELSDRKRVIFENDSFVVFCPFASRAAFEVWVMPKKHKPYFERTSVSDKILAGEALQTAISKIYKALNDPPYNFYIHTSPCDGKDYPHFHWHIEIIPHTSVWAGFELATGIEISTIEPEVAAEYLKKQ